MSKNTLKKLFLALSFWMAVHTASRAQTLPISYTGTSPIAFGVDSNGLLSAVGTHGTGTLSLSGAGTRMFWYPGKAAFRAGYVSGTDWDDAHIGDRSAAFGIDTTASAFASFAVGSSTTASNLFAFASGADTVASGALAAAFGNSTEASGTGSIASGSSTTASGLYSTSTGQATVAEALDSFSLGRFNVGGGNSILWTSTDPLFEIGNGADATHLADAFVIYKNGNMTANGVDNRLPNQTLTGGTSILTESLADARYVGTGPTTINDAPWTFHQSSGTNVPVTITADNGGYPAQLNLVGYTGGVGPGSVEFNSGTGGSVYGDINGVNLTPGIGNGMQIYTNNGGVYFWNNTVLAQNFKAENGSGTATLFLQRDFATDCAIVMNCWKISSDSSGYVLRDTVNSHDVMTVAPSTEAVSFTGSVSTQGNASVQGTLSAHTGLRSPQQGDLSMGSFTAGTAP